jgi:hypothetical protein
MLLFVVAWLAAGHAASEYVDVISGSESADFCVVVLSAHEACVDQKQQYPSKTLQAWELDRRQVRR